MQHSFSKKKKKMQHKGGVGRHRVGVSEVVGFLGHRLCLVRVKVFLENILFFGKENVFMCLAVTKFILRKINFGVWFI